MRRRDLALSAAFVVAIAFPLVTAPFAGESARLELRQPAPFPPVSADFGVLAKFPAGFQDWLHDHFGARSHLIRWQSAVKYRLLGLSSSPDVGLGAAGFLHYRPELEAHLPGREFTPAQLEAWRNHL